MNRNDLFLVWMSLLAANYFGTVITLGPETARLSAEVGNQIGKEIILNSALMFLGIMTTLRIYHKKWGVVFATT